MKKWILSSAAWAASLLPSSVKRMLYRNPTLAGLIRKNLNLAAPAGIHPVKIAGGSISGMQMYLDLQAEKDYWLGTYELDLQDAIQSFVHPSIVAYDIGANIGYITLMLARKIGEQGLVYAFEALPANQERLRANVKLNNLQERVIVVDRAVVDRDGPVEFMVGPSGGTGKATGSAGRQEFDYNNLLSVPGVTLDNFVYNERNPEPGAIKIDIEGGEILALAGMQRVLKQARPLIFLELHGHQAAQIAWEILTENGYQISRMQAGCSRVTSVGELNWKSYLVAFPGE